ncbi:MAG: ABC transporter ATP-binding protein/permease, partial [Candidatus Muirbacterium halophilum]|nr:ABC transporter ATP-binding protein/permease [Candidatus Muirbacterium halophilum]
ILGAITSYIQVLITSKLGIRVVNSVKNRVFSHIMTLGMSFFDKNQSGKLMSRVESDVEQLKVIFTNSAIMLFSSVIVLIGILCIITYEQPYLGAIIFLSLPFIFVVFYYYLTLLRKIWINVRKKNSEISGYIAEYVRGIPLIQLFLAQDKVYNKLEEYSQKKFNLENKAMFYDNFVFWSFFSFFSESASMILILWYGINGIYNGTMTVGTLIMFGELMRQFFWPMRNLMMVVNQINVSLGACERIFDVLDTKTDVKDIDFNYEKIQLKDKILFDNISFKYENDYILKDFSLEIKKGEQIAVIGPSGSGKTTLINLLLRFYDCNNGDIYIDNVNIKNISILGLREKIALVLQEVNLFPGTIMENLKAFNDEIKDERVIQAAIELGSIEFIEKLEKGFYTELSEDGKNLSMGERQLISFTRAFVRNPDILILDEATSSIDTITEKYIQQALFKLIKDRTSIIIAHRLSTIENSDRIIVMENGNIVEAGNHSKLIKNNGLYSKLYNIQKTKPLKENN